MPFRPLKPVPNIERFKNHPKGVNFKSELQRFARVGLGHHRSIFGGFDRDYVKNIAACQTTNILHTLDWQSHCQQTSALALEVLSSVS